MAKTKNDATTTSSASTTTTAINDPVKVSSPPVAPSPTKISDGFDSVDESGTGSLIKGALVKFTNNAEWLIKESGEVIPPERELLVTELTKASQKWIDATPVETRIIGADEYFPDTERLNAEAPQHEWRDAFGKRVGPWQNSIVVYLFDLKSMEGFSFPTSTSGGFRAVDELKGHVRRVRMLQGNNVYPVVTLSDLHMNTAFGGRQRPHFKVQRFIALGSADARPAIAAGPNADMGGDQIPY
jgi:hypothetical protein